MGLALHKYKKNAVNYTFCRLLSVNRIDRKNNTIFNIDFSLIVILSSIEKDVKSSLEHKAIPKDEPKIQEEPKPVTEYSDQYDELVSKCTLSCIVFEGHEKPIQMEMYERPSEVKITSNLVLRPESYKDLLKVLY